MGLGVDGYWYVRIHNCASRQVPIYMFLQCKMYYICYFGVGTLGWINYSQQGW